MSAKLRRAAPVTCMSLALIAVAAISGSAQARTAADPSPGVAGIDRAPQFTGLAASFLTRPQRREGHRRALPHRLRARADERGAVPARRQASRGSRWQNPPGAALAPRPCAVLEDEFDRRRDDGGDATRYDRAQPLRLGGRLARRPSATQGGPARCPAASRRELHPPPTGRAINAVFKPDRSRPAAGPKAGGAGSARARRHLGGRRGLLRQGHTSSSGPARRERQRGRSATLRDRLDEARSEASRLGRRPRPLVQLPQLRSAPDRRRRRKGRIRPRRPPEPTAAERSNTAVGPRSSPAIG